MTCFIQLRFHHKLKVLHKKWNIPSAVNALINFYSWDSNFEMLSQKYSPIKISQFLVNNFFFLIGILSDAITMIFLRFHTELISQMTQLARFIDVDHLDFSSYFYNPNFVLIGTMFHSFNRNPLKYFRITKHSLLVN